MCRNPSLALLLLAVACSPIDDDSLRRRPRKPLEAFCEAHVVGVGIVDIENDYLPHVVQCENGGAPFAALKAQAVAARSYLYYKLETEGSIENSQRDQVYSCAGSPDAEQALAVFETSGQVLTFRSKTLCTFYVAGAKQVPPTCMGSQQHYTERFVTYNWGLSGDDLLQSPLGLVHERNLRNRGCMSQWGARCLADDGWTYLDILKFYYGADITLESASGPCIVASNQPPRGQLESIDCDEVSGWAQDPNEPEATIDIQFWFDGAPGTPGATSVVVRTTDRRTEHCDDTGACAHHFSLRTPLGLRDGRAHSVYAVALDTDGGVDAKLEVSPRSFRCGPPSPPIAPSVGVRRLVPSLDVLNAWQLSLVEDTAQFTEDEIEEYALGPPLPEQPVWIRLGGGIWLVDGEARRAVSGPHAMRSWRIHPADVRSASALDANLPPAANLPDMAFLVRNGHGEIFMLDRPRSLAPETVLPWLSVLEPAVAQGTAPPPPVKLRPKGCGCGLVGL